MITRILLISTLFLLGSSQLIGRNQAEVHPNLDTKICRRGKGCSTQSSSIVLDANWRWLHSSNGYQNCYTGNTWDKNLCPDSATCTRNCALEGVNYEATYGIKTDGNSLTLKFVTKGQYGDNIGSRVFLMSNDSSYTLFKLKNQEFTFDVDVSNLPCGLNGALYFVNMDGDGGKSKYPTNEAGAKYGTGYCDAQCPHDLKYINGQANCDGWVPSSNDKNAGAGKYGTCCSEMDIWEANSQAAAYTPHVCNTPGTGSYRCSGAQCGDDNNRYGGVCDKDGCDFNSYRMGDQGFFGEGKKVDTKQKLTVVTQFITRSNNSNSDLVEIRRKYVQNGKVISNSKTQIEGMKQYDSVSDKFCSDQKKTFGDMNDFQKKGGMTGMGKAMDQGMVLVMSLWDDHAVNMLWLDSSYPLDKPKCTYGVQRGPCSTDSGKPSDVEANHPDASVTFSNIRFGDIDSTYQ